MYKKILSAVMALALVAGAGTYALNVPYSIETMTASALIDWDGNEYTEGTYESLTYQKYEDHVVISGCDKTVTEVNIPAEIEGLPVTEIAYSAFYGCSDLTEIIIPDSITSIAEFVFKGTKWLKNKQAENPFVIVNNILVDGTTCEGDIVIPENVNVIGDYAFYENMRLTSVTIPDSVTKINVSAFGWCKGLESVNIPVSVTSIGLNAFQECHSLTELTIPDSVQFIDGYAFYACKNLTSINIPDGITSIGNSTFYDCEQLGSISIPDSVTTIGGEAFRECKSLTEIVIPDSVTSIGSYAFQNCYSLAEINIPDSVTSIGHNAFSGCISLTEFTIPDSITSIEDSTFWNCTSLTEITIPENVKSIGESAFYYCRDLESITILNPDCEIFDDSKTICTSYDENYTPYFKGTIYGYENSTAQAYAEKYGYTFESLGEAPEATEPPTTEPPTTEPPTTEPPTTEPPTEDITYGDANCDGVVSIADATAILQHLGNKDKYSLSEQGEINADVAEPSGITANDAIAIQQLDAGLIEKLPL